MVRREYKRALAPATWRNKRLHLQTLMEFCNLHELRISGLEEYDVISYILFLKDRLTAPGAVHNYLSGARTWFLAAVGSAKAFDTYKVGVIKRGLRRTMPHVTHKVPPITPAQLEHIARVLTELGKPARVVKALAMIAFFSALRQSNLLNNTQTGALSTHVLLARDIKSTRDHLLISVRSSKTIKSPEQRAVLRLPRMPASICCPCEAWDKYVRIAKLDPGEPAFRCRRSFLTVKRATALIRLALVESSYSNPSEFTLHAFRRGAAHACKEAGSSLETIKELGQWGSNAVFGYLPNRLVHRGPDTLKACFGEGVSLPTQLRAQPHSR